MYIIIIYIIIIFIYICNIYIYIWKTCIEETVAQHNQHTSLHISFRQCDASLWLLQWLVIMLIYLWYGVVSLCFQDQLQLRNVARQCMATPAPDKFSLKILKQAFAQLYLEWHVPFPDVRYACERGSCWPLAVHLLRGISQAGPDRGSSWSKEV